LNEAILAYDDGKVPLANKLYKEAEPLADPGDLRVLNGLYITSWQLGQHDAARDVFGKLVESGLEQKRLPVKLLFQPGKTQFNAVGDLPQQYNMWIASLAQKAGNTVRTRVGRTSRTGSARAQRPNRAGVPGPCGACSATTARSLPSAAGVGSREALVGLGTDDVRDALDRRVEFSRRRLCVTDARGGEHRALLAQHGQSTVGWARPVERAELGEQQDAIQHDLRQLPQRRHDVSPGFPAVSPQAAARASCRGASTGARGRFTDGVIAPTACELPTAEIRRSTRQSPTSLPTLATRIFRLHRCRQGPRASGRWQSPRPTPARSL
jgi:hypothetical protein